MYSGLFFVMADASLGFVGFEQLLEVQGAKTCLVVVNKKERSRSINSKVVRSTIAVPVVARVVVDHNKHQ